MEKYSCIIVDDEPRAIELLADHIGMLNKDVEIMSTYTSWEKAAGALRSRECDILFLDISINDKNGMDLLKLIPNTRSEVVFVTAHSNFALKAIKYSPCGYILKPIDEIELAAVLDKAIERVEIKRAARQAPSTAQAEKVGIFNNKGIDYVNVTDIVYFEADNQYTNIITLDAEYKSSYPLAKYSHITSRYPFFKVHRSYTINLQNIVRYETSGLLIMANKKEIPVARAVRNELLNLLNSSR